MGRKRGTLGKSPRIAARSKQEAGSRKPVWEKYMKTDFINLVTQPGDRKRVEKERQNLHNILML